ncbi:hypothetical protein [Photorhabdus khanii]|uniref:Uncharacterized protein n=1 Tax=Photorhabdus khanii subsp. guanajuatensis TaxID=2100166 RepID=A0A4R4INL4_9GAMM|nr:hypothetical protein [Photorhabdus khanii]TDB42124.1 hypothetical protein C5467_24030 [Photorhabdus khanii subsp. guanajuatensis]
MYTGIAIYNSKELSPIAAYELGSLFFSVFDITITGAGYYKYIKNGDDHDLIEIPFSELKEKILSQEATAFRIYCEQENYTPWLSSFGYTTNEFGSFYHIDAQFPNKIDNHEKIISFIKLLVDKIKFSYGVIYDSDRVTKTFYYATGNNLVNIYPYENPSVFKRETPGRFNGKERYNDNMLRMVYLYNIINNFHLKINVGNANLKQWILGNKEHGSLEKLNDELWLWKVEKTYLDEINKFCGEAGILIAWKAQSPKKIARKLP